jgi:hypothetical protein
MTLEAREHKKRHAIEKYKRKVNVYTASHMYNRFNPDLNFSVSSFAFNLSINLNIDIDVEIVIHYSQKARYGFARYGVDVYDPFAPIGILVPDELSKQLYTYMVRHFTPATYRGYKYSMRIAIQYLNANLPIFEKFAPIPVWLPRFRKIEAWRTWTSFFDLACFDVNIFPCEEVFIRVTDEEASKYDSGKYDYNVYDGYEVAPRIVRNDNLSSNLYDHAVYDRSFYPNESAPYPEILLLAPNLYCYEPVFDVANFDYDVFLDVPTFDPDVMYDIMEEFKQTQQPLYRELIWFTKAERMQTMYTVQATYQHDILTKILRAFRNEISSPIQISQVAAFAMEYGYERKFMRLVEAEKVIDKYVSLGFDEGLLRRITAIVLRK